MADSMNLEDLTLGANMGAGTAGQTRGLQSDVALADITNLDIRTIYNKTIYTFLANWGMFYLNLDDMIFNPADENYVTALKATAVSVGIDLAGSALRRQFPMLIM